MTTEEKIDRLTSVVETLAGSVVAMDNHIEAHDRQIGALITLAEKHEVELSRIESSLANLERQWQAYINTLPRQ